MTSQSIGSSIPKAHQVPEEIKQAARLTVCAHSLDKNEAAMLMKMLGIHPSQEASELNVESGYIPHTPPRLGWT